MAPTSSPTDHARIALQHVRDALIAMRDMPAPRTARLRAQREETHAAMKQAAIGLITGSPRDPKQDAVLLRIAATTLEADIVRALPAAPHARIAPMPDIQPVAWGRVEREGDGALFEALHSRGLDLSQILPRLALRVLSTRAIKDARLREFLIHHVHEAAFSPNILSDMAKRTALHQPERAAFFATYLTVFVQGNPDRASLMLAHAASYYNGLLTVALLLAGATWIPDEAGTPNFRDIPGMAVEQIQSRAFQQGLQRCAQTGGLEAFLQDAQAVEAAHNLLRV